MEQHANLCLKHGLSEGMTCLYNQMISRKDTETHPQQSRHLGIQDMRLKAKESRLERLCL